MTTALIIVSAIATLLFILLIRTYLTKPDGILGIDKRDLEKDFWDFVLLAPPEVVEKKRFIKIEVKVKS